MNTQRIITMFTLAVFCGLLGMASSTAYQYQDNTVYINNTNTYISATPHTITGSGDVIIEFETKTADLNANIIFGYNGEYLKVNELAYWNPHNENNQITFTCTGTLTTTNPRSFTCTNPLINGTYDSIDLQTTTITYTETTTNNWTTITKTPKRLSMNYDGKNAWYYAENVPLKKNIRYKAKLSITAPYIPMGKTQAQVYPDYDGKYDIAFYPSTYGNNTAQAITDGNFYYLDPVVNLTNGLIHAWGGTRSGPTNCTINWVPGGQNLTIVGGSAPCNNTNSALPNGSALEFATTGGWYQATLTTFPKNTDDRTMCAVITPDSTSISNAHLATIGNTVATEFAFFNAYNYALSRFAGVTHNTTTTIVQGTPYHQCVVVNYTTNKTVEYINGINVLNYTGLNNITNTGLINLGGGDPNGGNRSDGKISYLKIWNRALTIEDIAYDYNNGTYCDYNCTQSIYIVTINNYTITTGDPVTITMNCTSEQTINSAIVQITDPNSAATNYTMTLIGGLYTKNYTASIDGTYQTIAYCTAGAKTSNTTANFTYTAPITSGGGGSGGGVTIVTERGFNIVGFFGPLKGWLLKPLIFMNVAGLDSFRFLDKYVLIYNGSNLVGVAMWVPLAIGWYVLFLWRPKRKHYGKTY